MKSSPSFRTSSFPLLAALVLAVPSWLPAGQYPSGGGTQPFTYANGTTNLGDGTTIGTNTTATDSYPSAVILNNVLRLTQNRTANTSSSFKLPDLDPGLALASWDVTLQFAMDVRFGRTPADGWSLNIGPIPAGNGGGEGGFVMTGGLFIAFDTYGTQQIVVSANGIAVGSFPQTFSFDSVYRSVSVHWDSGGLDVSYNGTAICTNLATPGYTPASGHTFAFSARTGSLSEGVYLDNLQVATTPATQLNTGGPVISEFCADNANGIEDENGDSSDWIEIYNGAATAANLAGWTLTDDVALPAKWTFPSVSVPAYGYLKLFASSKNRTDPAYPLHTNFSISKASGYLALFRPNATAASEFTYGAQAEDISYGLLPSGASYVYGYLETPTPGAANSGLQAAGPPAEDVVYLKDGVATTGGLFANSFTLSIQTPAAPGSVVRYTTDNTPPTATSPVYSTPLTISSTTTVRARVYTPDRLPGPVASRTFLLMDSTLTNYHGSGQPFSSNLPIIVFDSYSVPIDNYTTEGSRPYRLTYSVVIDKNPSAPSPDTDRAVITATPDFQGRGGTHVRGETSAGFPQKSYAWELWNNDNEDKTASILGFPAESDWVLHAPYTDKTLMRNYIAYDRMRALAGKSEGMGVKFVEVFFNQDGGALTESDYRGVYTLIEKIKRSPDRVDIQKLSDLMTDSSLISGGYIFKRDKNDPGDVTFATTLMNSTTTGGQVPGFTFDEPSAPNATQKTWLTNHVNAFEAALTGSNFADPATGYAAYINTRSFIDNQWLVEITKQIDGYRWSTYYYKDRNGKINAGPIWDYNLSCFNANYNGGDSHSGWYYSVLGTTDYYYWPRLHQDPNYEIQHWDRYWEMRRGIFATTTLLNYIDGLASQLTNGSSTPVTNSMANQAPLLENPAMRHYRKWPVLGSYLWPNPNNYGGRTKYWNGASLTPTAYTSADAEVDAMKNFLMQRLAWIDDQDYVGTVIYRPVNFSLSGGSVTAGTPLTITPYTGTPPVGYTYATGGTIYYTTDGSDPRSSGGSIAGTAYTGPLALNQSGTIKARYYLSGNWSPVTTATFAVNAAPASAADLVISEISYRPLAPAPGTPEYLAGYTSGNNFEYVEILNVSGGDVDLTGCAFTQGITFSFASVPVTKLILPAGGRALVVGNEGAFTMRFGSGLSNQILGVFGGNLNNTGETVTLLGADLSVIASVTYGYTEPWPTAPYDSGFSLVLANARANPTYTASDFRSSLQAGGTPGTTAGFAATVALSDLARVYNGSPQGATASTDPVGLPTVLTYNASPNAPTDAGSYTVDASVSHPDYTGTANGTLVIAKGTATVTLGDLAQAYDGTPKPASASTTPGGLTVDLTYDGSATAPMAVGSYAVVATVADTNYEGSANGTLVISMPSFADWQTDHFTPTQITNGEGDPEADPDHDGNKNLIEYALGTDPNSANAGPTVALTPDPGGVKRLTMTFVRPAGLPGIEYTVEVSDSVTFAGCTVISSPAFEITPIVGTTNEQVTVRDPEPETSGPHRFMRLRVTRP